MDCLCFGDNALIVTEGRNNRNDTAGIRFIILDHAEERIEFSFMLPSENSSPFGLCELGDKIVCSHLGSHCLYELNVDTRNVSVIAGKLDDGTDDGPVETASFSSPSGLASRGEVLYNVEHPLNQQGAIRLLYSLSGLANFQTIWHGLSHSMGMVPKMFAMKDKGEASLIKNKSLVDALPDVKDYANDLSALINAAGERSGVNSLDIRNWSMPSKTAEAVTKTLAEGWFCLTEYFNYISRQTL